MNKTLYIFATSPWPDTYINAIAYAVEHLQVKSVCVIVVAEHRPPDKTEKSASKTRATAVVSAISRQLEALAEGHYLRFGKNGKAEGEEALDDQSRISAYGRCLETINRSGTTGIVIQADELDAKLRSYIDAGPCIFDVSAFKKNWLVDVVSILLSLAYEQVYVFDLQKPQTFDQRDLYHALSPNEHYVYRNLASSPCVKASLRRISRWSARVRLLFVYTAVLAAAFLGTTFLLDATIAMSVFNAVAMAASIGSYLFLLARERRQ